MLVLRLETEGGIGVFQHGRIYDMYDHLPPNSPAHMAPPPGRCPSPWTDTGIGRIDFDEVCGFADWDQYRMWFTHPDMDEALEKAGVSMCIYDVPDDIVKLGEYQVVFHRYAARKVDRQPCSALRERMEMRNDQF